MNIIIFIILTFLSHLVLDLFNFFMMKKIILLIIRRKNNK